jgi:hypothetical protein
LNLLGAGGQLDAFFTGSGLHAGIWRGADMPASSACGMYNYLIFKALVVYQGLKHAFRQRRAADVTEADEADFEGFGKSHSMY